MLQVVDGVFNQIGMVVNCNDFYIFGKICFKGFQFGFNIVNGFLGIFVKVYYYDVIDGFVFVIQFCNILMYLWIYVDICYIFQQQWCVFYIKIQWNIGQIFVFLDIIGGMYYVFCFGYFYY